MHTSQWPLCCSCAIHCCFFPCPHIPIHVFCASGSSPADVAEAQRSKEQVQGYKLQNLHRATTFSTYSLMLSQVELLSLMTSHLTIFCTAEYSFTPVRERLAGM